MTETRRSPFFPPIVSAVLLAFLSGCGESSGNAPPVSPTGLVLRSSDLPSGFKRQTANYVSNASAARTNGVPVSTVIGKGRVQEYDVTFQSPSGAIIGATVTSYKTTDGAQWGYAQGYTAARRQPTLHEVHLDPVADQSAAFRGDAPLGGNKVLHFVIYGWRHGPYQATVQLASFRGPPGRNQILHYAHIVDGRIASHL